MSTSDHPSTPPDDELAALFASERRAPSPPDAMRAAVLAGVHKAVAAGAVAGATGGTLGTAAGVAQGGLLIKGLVALAVVASVAGGTAWVATRGSSGPVQASAARGARVVATSGARAESGVRRATEPGANVAPSAGPSAAGGIASGEPRATGAGMDTARATGEPTSAPTNAATNARTTGAATMHAGTGRAGESASEETDRDLLRENNLLDPARNAAGEHNGAGVLAAVRRHADEFPHGRLAQERDLLWIQGLALEGNLAEARARAERFRRTYPRSQYESVIAAALGQSP